MICTDYNLNYPFATILAHLLLRVQTIDRCFIFPPHLFHYAHTLPWETIETKYL